MMQQDEPSPDLRLREGHSLSIRVRLFMADDSSAPGSGYHADCPRTDDTGGELAQGAGGDRADEAEARQREADARRNEYFNQLQRKSGSVRTLCRVRPRNDNEAAADERMADIDAAGSRISLPSKLGVMKDYEFNHAFGPDAADTMVLDKAWESIEKALGGTDTTVIFYGQTGSGKSYLMDKLIKRMSTVLFNGEGVPMCLLTTTWVEVYNGRVRDLLRRKNGPLEVDLKRDGEAWKHDGSRWKLDSLEDFQVVHKASGMRRATSKTRVNSTSSRSHSIFTLFMSGLGGRSEKTKLQLVDLAGSEEVDMDFSGLGDKDRAEKETQNAEAAAIKLGLTHLGSLVRHAEEAKRGRSRAKSSTPFFQDPLTKLVGPTIVGRGAETLMIFMLSPLEAHRGKTLQTLLLADEVLDVHLKKSRERVEAR